MKVERSHTDALIRELKTSLPKSRMLKHSDRFTTGIPDLTCSWNHATSWLEIKRLKATEIIFDQLDQDQLLEGYKLQIACDRAWVIAFQAPRIIDKTGHTWIYSPRFLFTHRESRNGSLLHPERIDDVVDVRKLWEQGVLHLAGYNYESIVTLITKTHL
jgi:hypothetical protein